MLVALAVKARHGTYIEAQGIRHKAQGIEWGFITKQSNDIPFYLRGSGVSFDMAPWTPCLWPLLDFRNNIQKYDIPDQSSRFPKWFT
jgi:hypothetical protein